MATASKKLEQMAKTLLMLDIKIKTLGEQKKELQAQFIAQCIKEDLYDKDTKAIGDVRTSFTPNRYFDLETALSLVSEKDIKESEVTIVDPALLKQHMTPIQLEKSMKDYELPLKVGVKPNE